MIGILGGTFDPFHIGHLRMAIELYEQLELEQVRFIPTKQPVHKKPAVASPEHRLKMLQLALTGQSEFMIDEREIRRSTPSYMIETLLDLHQEMPNKKFGLIIGSDALAEFHTWHRYEEIVTLAQIIVVLRPGFEPFASLVSKTSKKIERAAKQVKITPLAISASAIREKIRLGKSIHYLVPEAVESYIRAHHLYQ